MEMLDGNIVTTSAPRIARSLGVPPSEIGLTITVYIVTLATLIPLSGWMSARWGARRVFLSAIALFALGSLGCALAGSLSELVAMRVVQAAGGALMVPVGRLVVLTETEKHDLLTMTAYLVWPALVAPVVAPLVGGLITTYAGWHWLFIVNLPIATVAFVVALRLIDAIPPTRTPPLDVGGVVLTCASLAGLTATAGLLSSGSPHWALALAAGAVSAVAGVLAVRHLVRRPAPLIDLRVLRIGTFASAVGGSFIFLLAAGATPFLLPLLFQEVFGWSPVKSGALVLVIFLGVIITKPATTHLYRRVGFRFMLVAATGGSAATLAASAFLTASTPVVVVGLVLFVSGAVRSIAGTGYTTVAFSDLRGDQIKDANTLQATLQHLSQGFGVAAGTLALRMGHSLSPVLGVRPPAGAYTVGFIILGLLAMLGTVGALRLDPSAGDALRRRRAVAAA